MSIYPKAEWVPWKYDSTDGPTYFKGVNIPSAVVLHVMQGYASTARAWANAGHYGASWHFTIAQNGTVLQHLDFKDGGYHAGIASPPAPTPTWALWRKNGQNVNTYTIGIEHEGFSGTPFTPEQAEASRDLCRWLSTEIGFPFDRDHFPPHADIDLINRSDDFNSPALRADHYAFLFEEDDMADPRVDELITAVFGSKDRMDFLIANGNNPVEKRLDTLEQLSAPASGLVPHTHEPGKAVPS